MLVLRSSTMSTATASSILLVPGNRAGTVQVMRGNGDGTFTVRRKLRCCRVHSCCRYGDFNGDSKPDLVIADLVEGSNGTIRLLTNTAP